MNRENMTETPAAPAPKPTPTVPPTSAPYSPRLADQDLQDALRRAGGVLITGPKACGKTETARQIAQSTLQADTDPSLARQLEILPDLALQGATPRLIDEWQVHPILWDLSRHEIDRRREPGQFILTGSTAPGAGAAKHSGAGRFARLTMGTMTFLETGHSDATISLHELAKSAPGEEIAPHASRLTIPDIAQRLAFGGWPGNLGLTAKQATENNRDYLETIAAVDIRVPDDTYRDPQRVKRLLVALARGVGTEVTTSVLARDTDLSRDTVREYLDSLARIFVAQNQSAWRPHLRSRVPLRETPKRHLADPALAVAALHADADGLLGDLEFFGQAFESQVVHDLGFTSRQEVYHARGADGLEVDAILEISGRPVLVEVKLGSSDTTIDTAATHLQAFARRYLEAGNTRHAPVLLVVTGGGLSYTRDDGVHVVAFGNLGA
ncbi:hypothetical protein HMPREF9278_2124 [Mobiluncus mulieris FB024-16]|nr:hypothetical protein HMPREF9278_2124 [Mobiluncus mulieris FB024-16]